MLQLLRVPEGFLSMDDAGRLMLEFTNQCSGEQPKPLCDFFKDLLGKRLLISVKVAEETDNGLVH